MIQHHPSIVKSGLVLYLDAANKKSYSGTGNSWYDLKTRNISTLTNVSYSSSDGGILSYNGTNSTTLASNSITGVSQFTISVWFKTNTVANYNNVLDFNYGFYGSANVGPRLEMAANGSLAWVFSANTTNGGVYTGYQVFTSGLQSNTWYNIVITRTSAPLVATYVNGVYSMNRIDTGGNADAFVGTFNKITTGVGWNARYHNGYISNVLVYNRALTVAEVLQNYRATKGRFGL